MIPWDSSASPFDCFPKLKVPLVWPCRLIQEATIYTSKYCGVAILHRENRRPLTPQQDCTEGLCPWSCSVPCAFHLATISNRRGNAVAWDRSASSTRGFRPNEASTQHSPLGRIPRYSDPLGLQISPSQARAYASCGRRLRAHANGDDASAQSRRGWWPHLPRAWKASMHSAPCVN